MSVCSRHVGVLALLTLFISTACARDDGAPFALSSNAVPVLHASLRSGALAELTAASQGRTARGFEDEILRLEARAPGLGGLFLDTEGQPTAWLLPTANETAARTALRNFGDDVRLRGPLGAALRGGTLRLLPGRFAFSELIAGSRLIGEKLRVRGVISLDADERLNRVRIGVTDAVSLPSLYRALGDLALPESIFVVERHAQFEAATTLRDRVRSTGGGLQITNANGITGRCTLGYNVSILFYADTGFITAGHCEYYGIGGGGTNSLMYQNAYTAADTVGRVYLNPVWNRTDAECQGYNACTAADVMFVKGAPLSAWTKRIARTQYVGVDNSNGSIDISSWYTGASIIPFTYVGMDVYKVGRTTGYTRGTLGASCVNEVISPGYVVLCADRVDDSAVGGGDSGSPVFYPPAEGDPFYAIGILFAGSNMTTWDSGDQTLRCTSNCTYLYSSWPQIENHLTRYVRP